MEEDKGILNLVSIIYKAKFHWGESEGGDPLHTEHAMA